MAAALPLLGGIMSVSAKFGEYLVPPIKRQLSYMCCYSKNMKGLEHQVEELGDNQTVVKRRVDAAKRNLQIIGPDVEKWLSEVDKIRQITDDLREKATKAPKGWICGRCPNLKLRYKVSRRAKKMTKESLQLQERGKFERVSYPPPPGEEVYYPATPEESYSTSKLSKKGVMAVSQKSNVSMTRLVRDKPKTEAFAASQRKSGEVLNGKDTIEMDMNSSPTITEIERVEMNTTAPPPGELVCYPHPQLGINTAAMTTPIDESSSSSKLSEKSVMAVSEKSNVSMTELVCNKPKTDAFAESLREIAKFLKEKYTFEMDMNSTPMIESVFSAPSLGKSVRYPDPPMGINTAAMTTLIKHEPTEPDKNSSTSKLLEMTVSQDSNVIKIGSLCNKSKTNAFAASHRRTGEVLIENDMIEMDMDSAPTTSETDVAPFVPDNRFRNRIPNVIEHEPTEPNESSSTSKLSETTLSEKSNANMTGLVRDKDAFAAPQRKAGEVLVGKNMIEMDMDSASTTTKSEVAPFVPYSRFRSRIPNVIETMFRAKPPMTRRDEEIFIEKDIIEVEIDSSAMTTEIRSAPFELDKTFKSRITIEKRIMAALRDRNVNMIGLCGMGGVGKTTTVRRIEKMIKEDKMFDTVVLAVVTQQHDNSKIQNQIAEMLGLKLDGENLWARANRLHNRIMNEERILVILDDVWDCFNPREIGIPTGRVHCSCKILLTSRARDVCVHIGAHEIFSLEVLSGEEAWTLFSEEAGISHESARPCRIEKEVANECQGLPIALLSVARALKGRSKASWEDALLQLKRSIPTNIPGVLSNVYRPLELSYSHLEGNEVKNLFLLCSIFPEDSSIYIDDLVRYGLGLTIFEGIHNFREGRNRAHALIDILKDRFLVEVHKEGYVKMHDVVRDVAIFIRSRDKHWSIINGSLTNTMLPTWLKCTNLVFLLWRCNNQGLSNPERTFEKLSTLNVLDIHHLDFALPSSFEQLTNLRALHLRNCKLGDIFRIGYLVNLEILSFQGSDVKILPEELGKLCNLRLLDLTDCENLLLIESGVIAGLIQLEELYLTKSFVLSKVGEFEQLCNLTTLRIAIEDPMVATKAMQVFSKLAEYDISVGERPSGLKEYSNIPYKNECSIKRAMALFLRTTTPLGQWVNTLLMRIEDLRLCGDGSGNVMFKLDLGSQYLKQLRIQDCATMKQLASTTSRTSPRFCLLPILESLFLYQLPNINEICDGKLPQRSLGELRYLHLQSLPKLNHFITDPGPNVSLSKLRSIYIHDCQNLQSLFCISVARSLLQLEDLEIGDCQAMQNVFSDDGEAIKYVEFPKLNKLVLRYLNASEFATVNRISFPQLEQLKMEGLPLFKGFCHTKSSGDHSANSQILFNETVACPGMKRLTLEWMDESSKLFCHLQTGFLHGLAFLKVESCNRLKTIFSLSTVRALVNLKELTIRDCGMLVEVIESENEAWSQTEVGLFNELEVLVVDACSSLKSIFPSSVVRGLVSLKQMRILGCRGLMDVIQNDAQEQNSFPFGLFGPFPELNSLQLTNLPNVRSFLQDYESELPSLKDVRVDKNSPLLDTLSEIACNARQMIEYRKRRDLRSLQVSRGSTYESCKSYIHPHKSECEDADADLVHHQIKEEKSDS